MNENQSQNTAQNKIECNDGLNKKEEYEDEFKDHKEQKFKDILNVLMKIIFILSILRLILSTAIQDINLAWRALQSWVLILLFWSVCNRNHESQYQLNISVFFVYVTVQVIGFESHLKNAKENQYFVLMILMVMQKLLLKFIQIQWKFKMVILLFTYSYYSLSYFFEYKVDFFEKINWEFIILATEYLMFRYVLLLVDDDFREFMSNKFVQAKEAENQWLQSLDNISHGVMIYNLKENKIIFENQMIGNIFQQNNQESGKILNQDYQKMKNNKIRLYDIHNIQLEKELNEQQKKQELKNRYINKKSNSSDTQSQNKLFSIIELVQQQIGYIQQLTEQNQNTNKNFMDKEITIQNNKIKKELQDFKKEMEGTTYRIVNSSKKINIQCSVYESKKNKYGIISVADVTKVQQFEQQRVTDHFKNMYLQSIAHDLRTPLNTIISMNEHVINYFQSNKLIQSSLKVSIYQCKYLILILDQVQDLSKFQIGLFKLDNHEFNLREKFEYWIENIVIQTELKELKFEYQFDQYIPSIIYADSSKLQNIILNLVGNSIKHTNKGYIKIKISQIEDDEFFEFEKRQFQIQDKNFDQEQKIKFVIEDSGQGMSVEKQQNIFILFGQHQKSGQYENTGVGLGLAYCKMVVEQMNGDIDCESELGKGTKISFFITVGCKKNDKGLQENMNIEFDQNLKKKIKQSQKLIYNLYIDLDNQSEISDESQIFEIDSDKKEIGFENINGIIQKESIKNNNYLQQQNEIQEDFNIEATIFDELFQDQKIIETQVEKIGCTKNLSFSLSDYQIQPNIYTKINKSENLNYFQKRLQQKKNQ